MRILIRTNDSIYRENLTKNGQAGKKLESLEKYVSENAIVRLSLIDTGKNKAYATLDIRDRGLKFFAKSSETDPMEALYEVIAKVTSQLVKHKSKANDTESLVEDLYYFNEIDKTVNLEAGIVDDFDLMETEKQLDKRKKSARYKRTMGRYVDYLFNIKDIDNEIEKAENQIAILEQVFEDEIDTILYCDYVLLMTSIEQLKNEIASLEYAKENYKMNIRDEKYIEEIIDLEYDVLQQKRKVK